MLFTASTDNICDTSGECANFYKATKQVSKGTYLSSVNKRSLSISNLKKGQRMETKTSGQAFFQNRFLDIPKKGRDENWHARAGSHVFLIEYFVQLFSI
jgi:hypothetical protein